MRQKAPDIERVQALQDYFARHRVIPSYSSIAKLIEYGSKAAAYKLANRMVNAGILERGPDNRLIPTTAFFARQIIGSVNAGSLESIPDAGYDSIAIDSFLVEKPSDTVLFRVRGDSMIDAGILNGDIALICRAKAPRNGDIVVAIHNGEATLKELVIEGSSTILRPKNKTFQAIRPRGDVKILGVYIGLVRKIPR